MERGKLRPLLLLKLMLNQDIIIMATLMVMVTDMATMDMERGKLMPPPAIITMDMDTDMVDMAMDMERGRLMLLLVIIMAMDTPMVDMVDMAMDMDMERGKLMLPLVIIMDMDTPMVDMVDTATMDMERGR